MGSASPSITPQQQQALAANTAHMLQQTNYNPSMIAAQFLNRQNPTNGAAQQQVMRTGTPQQHQMQQRAPMPSAQPGQFPPGMNFYPPPVNYAQLQMPYSGAGRGGINPASRAAMQTQHQQLQQLYMANGGTNPGQVGRGMGVKRVPGR